MVNRVSRTRKHHETTDFSGIPVELYSTYGAEVSGNETPVCLEDGHRARAVIVGTWIKVVLGSETAVARFELPGAGRKGQRLVLHRICEDHGLLKHLIHVRVLVSSDDDDRIIVRRSAIDPDNLTYVLDREEAIQGSIHTTEFCPQE